VLPELKAYVRTAAGLGYRYLCANDHLVFDRPWLDGPTALAAVLDESAGMRLVTTASLPVLRGPVQLAKTLAAIDALSGGHLVAGVGPGSSPADYAAAGIGFEERWRRFDEAVEALRALLHGDRAGSEGEFYSTLPGRDGSSSGRSATRWPSWSCSASASPPSGADHR
jgi:alkanesulfonate monooxygenase SsuD/methylene tetrahydromethanopterin reductase-like flavin-dependent oxidoreductase (luciferase family)